MSAWREMVEISTRQLEHLGDVETDDLEDGADQWWDSRDLVGKMAAIAYVQAGEHEARREERH